MRPHYSTTPIVKEIIEGQYLAQNGYVFWAGGEPMMQEDFELSFKLMVDYGVSNEIATNSTIFSEIIYDSLKKGNVILKTSLDCGTKETFYKLKGVDLFDKTIFNLTRYASTGANVGAKYIVSTDNYSEKDLDGFIDIVKDSNIGYAYIDINHNLSPVEVKDEYIKAAAYLYANLKDTVNVNVGIHSGGSLPNFKKFVEDYTSEINIYESSMRYLDTDNYNTFSDGSDSIEGGLHPMASNFEEQIKILTPMTPEPLTQDKLDGCKLIVNRVEVLKYMPKNSICIEVGTQTGAFAKHILSCINPSTLHVVDMDYSYFDFSFFKEYMDIGTVKTHTGMSVDILSGFDDNYFDFIYIDADHAYEGVKNDLLVAVNKVKQNGYIACNDYTVFSPLENFAYGVPKAVNELLRDFDFNVVFFALDKWGYHDIVLQKN